VLPVAFNAVFTLSRLCFHGQLLEQLSVALTVLPYCLFAVLLIVTVILWANKNLMMMMVMMMMMMMKNEKVWYFVQSLFEQIASRRLMLMLVIHYAMHFEL